MPKHYAKDIPQSVPVNYVKLWSDVFDAVYLKAKATGKSNQEADQTAGEQAIAAVNQQLKHERTTGDSEGGHLIVEPDGTKHLPTTKHGGRDWGLLGVAYKALFPPEGTEGRHEGPTGERAKTQLKALYEQEGIPWPSETGGKRMSQAHLSDPDFRQPRLTEAGICATACDALALLAEKRANEKQIGYQVALSEISREYPGLAYVAREEVLGTRLAPLGGEGGGNDARGHPSPVAEQLAKMAEARAKEKKIDYQAALREVAGENPDLVRAARIEVLGVMPQGPGF
jgi:hypothetical protein